MSARAAVGRQKQPRYSAAALVKLRSSGLGPEDAAALGIEEVDSAATVHPTFFPVRALKLAYRDLDGSDTGFYRVRYLEAPGGFAGQLAKPQRYAQAPGSLNHVYLPTLEGLSWDKIAADATCPLLVTEGELKAACACRADYPTLGLGGVDVWRSRKRGVPLLPPLDRFEWRGREVKVVFDSDAADNPDVARAQTSLVKELVRLGAVPSIASLPGGAAKVGLDDFLVAGGDLEAVLAEARGPAIVEELVRLNEELVFVADQDLAIRVDRDLRLKRDSLVNGTLANRRVVEYRLNGRGQSLRQDLSVAQEWLRWPTRRTVSSLVYEPGRPRIVDDDYNLWRGWAVEPKLGDVAPWRELLDFLFDGDAEARTWFERWAAYPLQHPGAKLYAAAVLWGPETGTGKSLVGYSLGKIYGVNFAEIGNAELHSAFNEWAVGKQLIMGEEITGSDRRGEADKLKSLITQQKLRINMKHLPTYEVRDCLNYYFNSNHPDAFFIDDQDRRYFVHRVPHPRLPREFYQRYAAWLAGPGAAALFHHLLYLDLGDFDPAAPALVTASKREMVDHARSDLAAFVANLLRNLEEELRRLAEMLHLPETPDLVLNKHLRHLYDPDDKLRVTANGLGRELSRCGAKSLEPVVTAVFGRQRFYVLRNLRRWLDAKPEEVRDYVDRIYLPLKKKGNA